MEVYITKAAKFLPNDPVDNESMEQYLGMVDGQPSRARSLILSNNGIKRRYYALDKNGKVTHTNAQMAALAIKGLVDEELSLDDIDLLACGTATPEQIMPSHGVMAHGLLGGDKNIEVVSFAGSCCAGMDALKYAHMAVKTGSACNAVVSASERFSAWMEASYFQEETDNIPSDKPSMISLKKEFLRWMLSDGAYAMLLQPAPAEGKVSLRLDWIEITSFANTKPACMYAGGEKVAGEFKGWTLFPQQEWLSRSLFALKQDVKLLSRNIVPLGVDFLLQLAEKHKFTPDDFDWFLPHLSSMIFKDMIHDEINRRGFPIDDKKWFYNLPTVGNIASASAMAMLEELLYSGKLEKGQKILLMVPESARFSYCYAMFTVC